MSTRKINRQWIIRSKYLRALGTIYSVSLTFFLGLSLLFVSLANQLRTQPVPEVNAAVCSLPATVDTTIELTPDSADNVIDCSGQSITITSTGKLIIKSYQTADSSSTNDGGVVLKVADLTIQTGGEISADGQGYVPGAADGGSAAISIGVAAGSGGGHGGAGGTGNTAGGVDDIVGTTGATLGNKDYPVTLGGAGGTAGGGGLGGNGGGAIKVLATGTVTIDGKISADGTSGVKSADGQTAGGGGAGGSVWVEAAILAGSGQVSAKGGGTDVSAAYYGGGGGGGRVALICTSSTTFLASNASVAFGTGSQNGQVGSLVGPGCKPAEPTILRFYERNATAGKVDRELFVSELTSKTALTFASDLAGTNQKLEVEIRQKDQSFTNTATNSQVTAASNKTCTGIPLSTGVTISTYCGYVEVTTGFTASTEYKWQARIVSTAGIPSAWVQFGDNATSVADFTVVGAATSLIIVEGNNQSVQVGQLVSPTPKVRVVDAAGYGVPYYVLTSWSVLTGGGSLANSQLTADKWGEATAEWTVGTVAGVGNNTIKVSKTTPAMSATFTASAVPGAIASYQVVAQTSLSLINSPFTYTVTAVDEYNNIVPFTNNLTVVPVSSHNIASPGLGVLTPDTILFSGTAPTDPWLSAGWSYRKKVTFNNTTAHLGVTSTALVDFPVLIKLTSANFDFGKAKSGGEDIRITDTDGTTQLSYEIEKWDATGQEAYIWVKVPQIDADSATDFVYVYYGNATAQTTQSASNTWNSSYRMVQHLGETSGTTTNDSTTNNNDGTKLSSGEPAAATGAIDGAQIFDGSNDYISIPHSATLSFGAPATQFTLEAWVNTTSAAGEILTKARPTATTNMEYLLRVVGGKASFSRYYNSTAITDSFSGNITINDGNWHHVVFVNESASSHKLYVDGALDVTNTTTWTKTDSNTQAVQIGKYHNTTLSQSYFTGTIDEARISARAFSSAWIAATYKAQLSGFASYGTEEAAGDTTTVYKDPSTGVITIANGSYTYSESIKLKVYDANGKVGYSNSILFVAQTGSCPSVTIDTNQTWNAVDVPGGIFDCRGLGPFTVKSGYTLTLNSYNSGDTNYSNDLGTTLLVDSLAVESTGIISADGTGYPNSVGPSGDVHGGYSSNGGGTPYGSVYEPIELGSGGNYSYYGTAGYGGGAIKIASTGDSTIDGTISANGLAGSGNRYDGGAGGSVWLDTAGLSGSGVVRANGGYGAGSPGGGGSGGRVAVYYTTNSGFALDGTKVQAYGGNSASYGYSGPGTVYIEQKGADTSHAGTLIVDNNNASTPTTMLAGVPTGTYEFARILTKRYGHVEFMGADSVLTISSSSGFVGDSTKPLIKVSGTLEYTGVGRLTIDGVDLGINGKAQGIQDVTIGETLASGMTLYANTWYYNSTNGYSFGDLVVAGNGILTLVGYQNGVVSSADDYGVSLALTGLTVQSGGKITADGLGYPANVAVAGDMHGGYARNSTDIPYGSVYEPVTLGSGGDYSYAGTPGAGGGAIKLTVSGTSLIDGTVSANGLVGSGVKYDGGAGGSIWLTTGTLSGTGTLQANGGVGAWDPGNGGSGGRIAVYYTNNSGFTLDGTKLQAYGGNGSGGYAGPGTVYAEHVGTDPAQGGSLLVDNNNHNDLFAGVSSGTYKFSKIQTTRYGHVEFIGQDSIVEIASGDGMVGDSTKPQIKISGTLQYTGSGRLTIDGVDLGLNGKVTGIQDVTIGATLASGVTMYANTWYHSNLYTYSFGDMIVTGNGTLTMVGYQNGATDFTDDYGVTASFTGLTVQTGGKIVADGLGYPSEVAVAGEVHGGYARNSSGVPYGSVYEPVTLGSGGDYSYAGAAGAGGGAIKLVVSGTTTIDGLISANGLAGSGIKYDGGAGGSIWIDTGTIAGTGTIQVNGGAGASDPGNGGSGGRIAVYYTDNTGMAFSGSTLQAYGATGAAGYAGPGTVYVEHRGVNPVGGGDLLVDNNNHNDLFAGVSSGTYKFSKIQTTRYGHVEFIGQDSIVEIASGDGMVGDSTKPQIKISGTLQYTGSGRLTIDGVDLGINGRLTGVQDVTIGETQPSGVTLYANTWYHSNINGYSFGDVVVSDDSTLTVVGYQNGATDYADDYGAVISMSGLTVATTGKIVADGLGYPSEVAVAGEVHGGYARNSSGVPYGSVYEPVTLGSGGDYSYAGAAGAGGGAIKLVVSGTTTIDGLISANGLAGSGIKYDGGAGGSIWIDTGTIAGTGTIQVNGGAGASDPGNGGSGGRIAVYYITNNGFTLDGTKLQAYGGDGSSGYAGPGTVYLEHKGVDTAKSGTLLVDNNNHAALHAGVAEGTYQFKNVVVQRYGHVEFLGRDSVVNLTASSGFMGDATKPAIKIAGTLQYSGVGALVIDGVDVGISGKMVGVQDVTIGSVLPAGLTLYANTWYYNTTTLPALDDVVVGDGGTLSLVSYQNGVTEKADDYGVAVSLGSLTIQAGGTVTADGLGYPNGATDAGDVHGGYSTNGTGTPYGDIYEPVTLGSGGDYSYSGTPGAGGGALKLMVAGTTTIDGMLSANGLAGTGTRYDGGAGGSIWLDTETLSGSGTIFANGGTGTGVSLGGESWGSGGSGGRIAIYYTTNSGFTLDSSHVQARGGNGNSGYSGPGTVYIEDRILHSTHAGNLLIDNGLQAGRGHDFASGEYTFNDVTIGQNVSVWVMSDQNQQFTDFRNRLLTGRGVLFRLAGNFTLASGASINGKGMGFASGLGASKGSVGEGYSGGGGGGNGGNGGDGQSDGSHAPAAGGVKDGDQLQPLSLGSGGGASGVGALGGAGGGSFGVLAKGKLNSEDQWENGNITIAGTINMDGENGKTGSPGGGGGAGGSILLHGNTCDISGSLSASGGEGGNSDVDGGSGGGGRVSILYNVGPCTVTGTVSIQEGQPSDALNYGASVGQEGTFPPEPNSVPWIPQYQDQFEVREEGGFGSLEPGRRVALTVTNPIADVLGITESAIPIGGIINGTTVTLKADAYDAGARPLSPKRLKIQVELKKVAQAFDAATGLYDSDISTFSGGTPVVLSVTISNLEMGASYKWRVRTLNVDTGLTSEWEDFGENSDSSPDFTITTVSSIEMALSKTTMELSEVASITITAKNTLGNIDSSYRGTITFTSTSASAQLPASYTFTSGDAGVHTFTDALRFYEAGTFVITVEDTVNTTLVDSVSITILEPEVPYITLGTPSNTVTYGTTVTLTWESGMLHDLSLDQGIGAVATSGNVQVIPPLGATTYTISGYTDSNDAMTASVTITATDSSVPSLLLQASATQIAVGDAITLTWSSTELTNLTIDQGIGAVTAEGSVSVVPLLGTTVFTIQGTKADDTILTASVTIVAKNPEDIAITDTPTDPVKRARLVLRAATTRISVGEEVLLSWTSSDVTGLTLDNGIGSVNLNGSLKVRPQLGTTRYTIQGRRADGSIILSSVSIRATAGQQLCPTIVSFTASTKIIKDGESIRLSWQVENADRISISALNSSVSSIGSASVVLPKSQEILLFANKGTCERSKVLSVEVVNAYPWEGAGGMLIGLLAIETIGMQLGGAQANIWFALIGFIDRSKKRRPWGVVYNAVSKGLVPRAVVRLWDANSGILVDTVVTDANGLFKLTPKKGSYVIKVSASGYTFPSTLVNSTTDSGYTNIYTGEVIEVENENDMLMVSIPLDPIQEDRRIKSRRQLITVLEEFVGIISPVVLAAGFIYSVVVTMMYPLTLNFVILGLYALTFLLKVYLHVSTPKLFGMVTSVDGKYVSGLEIGLFDYEFKNLISRTFTNKQGAYNFVVKNQAYYLQVMDPGYKILSRQATKDGLHIPASNSNSGVKLVTESLLVYPVQKLGVANSRR